MEIKYIICTASGYYWHAYSSELNAFHQKDLYTLYDSEEEALLDMPKALKGFNWMTCLIIQKVYVNIK